MKERESKNPIWKAYQQEAPPPDAVWRRAAMIARALMYLAGAATAGLSAWSLSRGPEARMYVIGALSLMLMAGFATMVFTVAGHHARRMRPNRPSRPPPHD